MSNFKSCETLEQKKNKDQLATTHKLKDRVYKLSIYT